MSVKYYTLDDLWQGMTPARCAKILKRVQRSLTMMQSRRLRLQRTSQRTSSRPFDELIATWTPERRARIKKRVRSALKAIRLKETVARKRKKSLTDGETI